MSKLYKNYSDSIKELLLNGQRRGTFEKSFSNFTGIAGTEKLPSILSESKDESLFKSLESLNSVTGKAAKYHEKPGAHPDFSHLKQTNGIEYHYITSMFVDIKNSTALFKKYNPWTVANITSTIQRAAIHTSWYFDGFVQRYHGDGLFVYFGGKNTTMQQSITNAINTASFLSYFIQSDLKNLFSEQGVDEIYTRIGIDTGKEEDVLWYMAGIKDCSEITTCSLHTSLAYKMQANAMSNGIMVGDNVKDYSNLETKYFSIKKNPSTGVEERYIFQIPDENYHYTQWQLNWESYIKINPLFAIMDNKPASPAPKLNTDFLNENVKNYRPYFK